MVIANVLGIFFFLFFLWRRLKEDYHFEKTFTLATYILLGILVTFLTSKYLLPDYWFWLIFLGSFLGFLLGVKLLKMRFYETFDGVFLGLLSWIGLIFLSDSIIQTSLYSFLAFWVTVVLVFLFFFLDSQYRRFSWYKSGRIGFTGLATAGTFFLIRSVVAAFSLPVISFLSNWEGLVSGVVSFLFFLLLFNLSRTK